MVAAPMAGSAMAGAPAVPTRGRAPRGGEPRTDDALPILVRIAAWVVALPLALAIVGIPARKAGYLNGQRMLDIIVKHNLGRFVPLLVIVVLWALATAVLVTIFLEGGRRMLRKRDRTRVADLQGQVT